jgi:peptidyl-prolyl cis-trans isomerase D
MALIGTLRTKMTKVVVGFVAIAMIAFIVGSDLFGNGPRSIFGGDKNSIAEIAGHTVSLEEYQNAVQERENSYLMSFGRQPGEREQTQLRNEAWELLILKYAITPQFEKVGQRVTPEEEWDMVQGKNIDQSIKASFVDSAGKFDRAKLIGWMQTLDNANRAQDKYRWTMFRESLGPGRDRIKFENLLNKTNYVTDAEGERDYHVQNDVAEVKFLYVPFFAVSDSLVKVPDSDLKHYYDKNKERYKSEKTRSLTYVTFPVVPSAEDSAAILLDLNRIAQTFKTSTDDSAYAAGQTDGQSPYAKYTISSLPGFLKDQATPLKAGTVIGPFLEGGAYKVVKIVKIGTDTVYNARASHILIKWDQDTPDGKKAAKLKAEKILNDIKKGASFSAKAKEFGTDASASKGGDLGWFTSGQMVKPFQEAVFGAKKTGLLNNVVETQYGYHIIDVTGLKDNTAYTVATIQRDVSPSDETQNEAYRKAEVFASGLTGVDNFKAKANKENLGIFDANDLSTSERRINNLGEARTMVTWLFRDASVGKISEVFDLRDNYVVAVMTSEVEEGYKTLDKVKDEILPIVKNQLKGKIIIDKLNAQKGSLEEIAKAYGNDATVKTSSDLKQNTNSLPSVGNDPVAVGVAFSLESGKRSKPFTGENGVLIIEMQHLTIAPAVGDYTMFKNQLKQNMDTRIGFGIEESIKDASKIKDKRYKFY